MRKELIGRQKIRWIKKRRETFERMTKKTRERKKKTQRFNEQSEEKTETDENT